MTAKRLGSVAQHVTGLPLSATKPLPSFDELPAFRNFAGCAWGVWGPVNLLTEEVVQRAASEEIKYVNIALASTARLPTGLRAYIDRHTLFFI